MKQYLDVPFNIPSYRDVQVGDFYLIYNKEFAMDRKCACHVHMVQVKEKEERYAKLHCQLIKCYNDTPNDSLLQPKECDFGTEVLLLYSDMKRLSWAYRKLTGAAEVLFGVPHVNK